ncbi:hypothetical protein J2Z51_002145 [Enterococcus alcedinis]|nr:hypothetical protein [Enterococcus alcedinis]
MKTKDEKARYALRQKHFSVKKSGTTPNTRLLNKGTYLKGAFSLQMK